jgi:hypothetical protein
MHEVKICSNLKNAQNIEREKAEKEKTERTKKETKTEKKPEKRTEEKKENRNEMAHGPLAPACVRLNTPL